MTRNVDQLRSIQTFEDLIPFLEDDLDWPFPHGGQEYEFDDLTFEYTPDELGLEDEYAAKIKRIHQLRPLITGQPWGIFFVEFENKKLPIVVLRRILSHLVLKQRKSANPADRARWNAGDLLFISAFAEEGTLQREIAFAHFHQDPGDQPTLRVLGWDGGDTPLKLEHVSQILKHRLLWPRNPTDHVAWRKQWAGAFRHSIGQQIRTTDLLAQELARVARNIRDAAMALMKVESSRGPLRRMHEAFRIALIHDLTQEGFADTYAQTITYGLLTAAISRTDRAAGADGTFVLAEDVHNMVPITNPFLKEMLESFLKVGGRGTSMQPGLDFDELGVQEVVEMLRSSEIDLPAVLEDFGNRNPGEDPVIRFYEDFLKAYNKELKIKRGVFYTPQPVVSYIVRSVHEMLQLEFGLTEGLASTITWGEMRTQMAAAGKPFSIPHGASPNSHFVVILDPATGTATFLVEVIDVIFRTLTKRWKDERLTPLQQREEWNRYVPAHLLPRLFGYELLMAPYAIAHMKIGLKLGETGYMFATEERVRIHLTNALEPAEDFSDRLAFDIPALAHEAQAVNLVKRQQHFTVIVGNPPYSKSMSKHPWSMALVNSFKLGVKEKKSDLTREEWKFLAFGTRLCAASGSGVLGLVINNAFISAPTLRGIRSLLLGPGLQTWIFDLHGDSRKGETDPSGLSDENVFDIQQGVCILLAAIDANQGRKREIPLSDAFGRREAKYSLLSNSSRKSLPYRDIQCEAPMYFFRSDREDSSEDYGKWLSVPDIFSNRNSGIQTKNDSLFTDFEEDKLSARMNDVLQHITANREEVVEKYGLVDSAGWSVSKLVGVPFDKKNVRSFTYKPFDQRFLYYDKRMLGRARDSTMRHMLQPNLGLVATRQVTKLPFCHAFVSRFPIEEKTGSHDRTTQLFPLYLYAELEQLGFQRYREVAFSPAFRIAVKQALGLEIVDREIEIIGGDVGAECVFHFIYAVLYSPQYRHLYGQQLLGDFPRIPIPSNLGLFKALSALGKQLNQWHIFRTTNESQPVAAWVGGSAAIVDSVSYLDEHVWVNSSKTAGFRNVSEAVWEFVIGGYQICDKWLKDRKGRILSAQDIETYQKLVDAITMTCEIAGNIDFVIEEYGGWPTAFA